MIERRLRDRNADAASSVRVRKLVELALLVAAALYWLLISSARV
ncbi:MAG: hypothetical protein ACHQ2Z_05740 [Elusimicrobiota bacterium]